MKYIIWVDERDGTGWQQQGDGALTLKQAERISWEIREDCPRCRIHFIPVGMPLAQYLARTKR